MTLHARCSENYSILGVPSGAGLPASAVAFSRQVKFESLVLVDIVALRWQFGSSYATIIQLGCMS